MSAGDRFAYTRLLVGRLPLRDQQIAVEYVVNQGGFPGTRNASDARENAQRNIDINTFEVVLSGANDLDR